MPLGGSESAVFPRVTGIANRCSIAIRPLRDTMKMRGCGVLRAGERAESRHQS